jgi:flagellar assembly factor FliW
MEQTQIYSIDGLQFTESEILHFESGIPGFLNHKRWVISQDEDQEPFHWLHSVDDKKTKFVLINPMLVDPRYDPKIAKSDLDNLNVQVPQDMIFYVIVTIDHFNLMNSTVNLTGPILVNVNAMRGKQLIIDDPNYSIKTPITQNGGQ